MKEYTVVIKTINTVKVKATSSEKAIEIVKSQIQNQNLPVYLEVLTDNDSE